MSFPLPPLTDEQKRTEFLSFCIEQYAQKYGLSGTVVANRFQGAGLLEFISDNYTELHTQGRAYIVSLLHETLLMREGKK